MRPTVSRGPTQVVIEAGAIVEVGELSPLTSDVTAHDLGDVTLLPGLVDAHTHLTWDATREAVAHVSEADDEALLGQAQAAASAALAVGITTVRDLGDRGTPRSGCVTGGGPTRRPARRSWPRARR